MILAILFQEDTIVAAAPACDQSLYGMQYWLETHPVDLMSDEIYTLADFRDRNFETSYLEVKDPTVCKRLLRVGIDDSIDVVELLTQLERPVWTEVRSNRAA